MRAGARRVVVLAAALLATMWSPGGAAVADSVTAVDSCPADAVPVTGRQTSVTASAPEGYRITGYCVTVRGQGSEVRTFSISATSAELSHTSGKAITEYALAYEKVSAPAPPPTREREPRPEPESEPDESSSPDPASTPTSSPTPAASAPARTEETDHVEATDGDGGVAAAPRPMMDIDALLSNRANAEERAAAPAATEGTTTGLAPVTVAGLVLAGLAGVAAVAYLLLRRNRGTGSAGGRSLVVDVTPPGATAAPAGRPGGAPDAPDTATGARHLDAPTQVLAVVAGAGPAGEPPSSDDLEAEPRTGAPPRRVAPTFVVGDAADFPSIR